MFIVTGATGNTGSVVADELLAKGLPVRVIVRNEEKAKAWRDKGAEAAIANFNDASALKEAMKGGRRLYLMNAANYANGDMVKDVERNIAAFTDGINASDFEKIVVLSSAGAHLASGTGNILTLHKMEQAYKKLDLPVTFLRPPNFMENWDDFLPSAINEGVLSSFISPTDLKYPQIAADEIGKIAADSLLEDTQGVEIKELAGIDYSVEDVAKAIAAKTGREVKSVSIPQDQWMDILRTYCSEKNAEYFYEMVSWFLSGDDPYETDQQIRSAITLDQYLDEAIERTKQTAA